MEGSRSIRAIRGEAGTSGDANRRETLYHTSRFRRQTWELAKVRWVGIDEAGYGPNLGPLVMTAVIAEDREGRNRLEPDPLRRAA